MRLATFNNPTVKLCIRIGLLHYSKPRIYDEFKLNTCPRSNPNTPETFWEKKNSRGSIPPDRKPPPPILGLGTALLTYVFA